MPNSIRPSDILWTRAGDPVLVEAKNEKNGEVYLDKNFAKTQDVAQTRIKNGLDPMEREAYRSTLSKVENPDKRQEIQALFDKIKGLKESNADPRIIKYLQSELEYRMIREDYTPPEYSVRPVTLDI